MININRIHLEIKMKDNSQQADSISIKNCIGVTFFKQ